MCNQKFETTKAVCPVTFVYLARIISRETQGKKASILFILESNMIRFERNDE